MLRSGFYSYEHMDSWKRFSETKLPSKKEFYSSLYTEDITDGDYEHAKKKYGKALKSEKGDCHYFYVQSDTLLLSDVFENVRKKFNETYKLDPAHFLTAPGLEWQACLKHTKIKIELSTNTDILQMVEKGIRGGICHVFIQFVI